MPRPGWSICVMLNSPFCSAAGGTCGYLDCFLMWKLTLFCSMLRLMEAAESLSTADWKLLTEVLLLGLAESANRDEPVSCSWDIIHRQQTNAWWQPTQKNNILGVVYSFSSASCSVSLSSNLMSLNQDGSECPSRELTLSLSGDGVSENSVLWRSNRSHHHQRDNQSLKLLLSSCFIKRSCWLTPHVIVLQVFPPVYSVY